jgi:hypothetical protein
MTCEKYIGLDVHQATISGRSDGSNWQVGNGMHPGDEGFAQLSNHRQRSFPGHESAESAVPRLGNPLRGPGRLLHPTSQ